MQATTNPLRRPKPSKDQCVLHGRYYFTDEKGKLASALGTQIYLTSEYLWVTPELAIPMCTIDSVQVVDRRGLPPRHFIQVVYVNPITGNRESVSLCKLDSFGIGLHRIRPLRELSVRIEELRSGLGASSSAVAALAGDGLHCESPPLDRCEACGAKPAYYVGYLYLVSAILLCYRSEAKRRIHCRKHNVVHGVAYYLLTVLTGWIGIGIFAFPFVVYVAGRNLAPSLGKASYVLGVLPSLGLVALLVNWLA